jgi:hypothetical protein
MRTCRLVVAARQANNNRDVCWTVSGNHGKNDGRITVYDDVARNIESLNATESRRGKQSISPLMVVLAEQAIYGGRVYRVTKQVLGFGHCWEVVSYMFHTMLSLRFERAVDNHMYFLHQKVYIFAFTNIGYQFYFPIG